MNVAQPGYTICEGEECDEWLHRKYAMREGKYNYDLDENEEFDPFGLEDEAIADLATLAAAAAAAAFAALAALAEAETAAEAALAAPRRSPRLAII
jgi:hypothetical protein